MGQTAEAQKKKSSSSRDGKQWDEDSFFKALEEERGTLETLVAKKILEWGKNNGLEIRWGKGIYGVFRLLLTHKETVYWLTCIHAGGDVEVDAVTAPPFSSETRRTELLRRLNITMQPRRKLGWTELSLLCDETDLKQYLEGLEWAVQEIKAS